MNPSTRLRASSPLTGLSRSQAPLWRWRWTLLLAAAVLFTAGFFTGAISFGAVLVRSERAHLESLP